MDHAQLGTIAQKELQILSHAQKANSHHKLVLGMIRSVYLVRRAGCVQELVSVHQAESVKMDSCAKMV